MSKRPIDISAGFVLNCDNLVLLGHARNTIEDKPLEECLKEKCWSIPKGHLEPHEDFLQAALRETYEETGIHVRRWLVRPDYMFPMLGSFYTSRGKFVQVFMANLHKEIMNFSPGCSSIVINEDVEWNGKSEFDNFKWFTLKEASEYAWRSQRKLFQLIDSTSV